MPTKPDPKKSKRAQAAEKAEKDWGENTAFFHTEQQARDEAQALEILEWMERRLQFREGQVDLMVDCQKYSGLLQKVEEITAHHTKVVLQVQGELELTQRTKAKLEDELADIRIDQKLLVKALPKQLKDLETRLALAVQKAIDFLDLEQDVDHKMVARDLHLQFGRNKQLHLDLLHELQLRLGHLSEVLQESKSMHSNLPIRVRHILEERPKEELLFMIDALSFEDGVAEYFERKFPKSQPQRRLASTACPSSNLLHIEDQTAVEAAGRVPTP